MEKNDSNGFKLTLIGKKAMQLKNLQVFRYSKIKLPIQ